MIALREDRFSKREYHFHLLKISPHSVRIEYNRVVQLEATYRSFSPTASCLILLPVLPSNHSECSRRSFPDIN